MMILPFYFSDMWQLESEDIKKLAANLERITSDYQQMKTENNVLIGKVKQQTSANSC